MVYFSETGHKHSQMNQQTSSQQGLRISWEEVSGHCNSHKTPLTFIDSPSCLSRPILESPWITSRILSVLPAAYPEGPSILKEGHQANTTQCSTVYKYPSIPQCYSEAARTIQGNSTNPLQDPTQGLQEHYLEILHHVYAIYRSEAGRSPPHLHSPRLLHRSTLTDVIYRSEAGRSPPHLHIPRPLHRSTLTDAIYRSEAGCSPPHLHS